MLPWVLLLAPGLARAEDFSRYPILAPDVQAHYLSSYDRSGGNDDGFDGTYSALYVDEKGEHVIFDVKGPGALFNLWFTSRVNGFSPLGTVRTPPTRSPSISKASAGNPVNTLTPSASASAPIHCTNSHRDVTKLPWFFIGGGVGIRHARRFVSM